MNEVEGFVSITCSQKTSIGGGVERLRLRGAIDLRAYVERLERRQSVKAELLGVIGKLRDRLACIVLHGDALILNWDAGDEFEFRLWVE